MLLLLPGCLGLFEPLFAKGPYRGRVIDTDTKQPIEGAAVLAVWYSVTPTIGDKVDAYLDAEEVLTDKDGRFVIGKHTPISFRPGWIRGPDITIFYPGYGSYPRYHAAPKVPVSGTDELCERMAKEGLTIELRQLTTREERRRIIEGAIPLTEIPLRKIPNFVGLVNIERKAVGIPPYTVK
jgi:hypothetical protein